MGTAYGPRAGWLWVATLGLGQPKPKRWALFLKQNHHEDNRTSEASSLSIERPEICYKCHVKPLILSLNETSGRGHDKVFNAKGHFDWQSLWGLSLRRRSIQPLVQSLHGASGWGFIKPLILRPYEASGWSLKSQTLDICQHMSPLCFGTGGLKMKLLQFVTGQTVKWLDYYLNISFCFIQMRRTLQRKYEQGFDITLSIGN